MTIDNLRTNVKKIMYQRNTLTLTYFKRSKFMRQQQLMKPNCKTCSSEKLKA